MGNPVKFLIVIPFEKKAEAEAVAAANFRESEHIFGVPCSATGDAPKTHLACGANIEEEALPQVEALAAAMGAVMYPAGDTPEETWAAAGLRPIFRDRIL